LTSSEYVPAGRPAEREGAVGRRGPRHVGARDGDPRVRQRPTVVRADQALEPRLSAGDGDGDGEAPLARRGGVGQGDGDDRRRVAEDEVAARELPRVEPELDEAALPPGRVGARYEVDAARQSARDEAAVGSRAHGDAPADVAHGRALGGVAHRLELGPGHDDAGPGHRVAGVGVAHGAEHRGRRARGAEEVAERRSAHARRRRVVAAERREERGAARRAEVEAGRRVAAELDADRRQLDAQRVDVGVKEADEIAAESDGGQPVPARGVGLRRVGARRVGEVRPLHRGAGERHAGETVEHDAGDRDRAQRVGEAARAPRGRRGRRGLGRAGGAARAHARRPLAARPRHALGPERRDGRGDHQGDERHGGRERPTVGAARRGRARADWTAT
jgi:hypothetical protein